MGINTWVQERRAKAKPKKIPVHTNGVLGRRVSGKLAPEVEELAAPRRAYFDRKVDPDGARRRGRVFTLRLEPKDEELLRKLKADHERQIEFYHPSRYGIDRRNGLGAFIVWAALQFKPAAKR